MEATADLSLITLIFIVLSSHMHALLSKVLQLIIKVSCKSTCVYTQPCHTTQYIS